MDLIEFVEKFVAKLPQHLLPKEADLDQKVVLAISSKEMESGARVDQLVEWLRYYKVLMYFSREKAENIAKAILAYADAQPAGSRIQGKDGIRSKYKELEQRLLPFARQTKSGLTIGITSLTSKALWCCYPQEVPIFDSHALSALRVLSRMYRVTPESGQNDYEVFVGVWFSLYEKIKPFLDQADLSCYNYQVRVFDRMLWHLGQPNFDTVETAFSIVETA
jgi:hypothetical protein